MPGFPDRSNLCNVRLSYRSTSASASAPPSRMSLPAEIQRLQRAVGMTHCIGKIPGSVRTNVVAAEIKLLQRAVGMTYCIGKIPGSVRTNVVAAEIVASAACSWNDLLHRQDTWLRPSPMSLPAEIKRLQRAVGMTYCIGKIPGSVRTNVVAAEIKRLQRAVGMTYCIGKIPDSVRTNVVATEIKLCSVQLE